MSELVKALGYRISAEVSYFRRNETRTICFIFFNGTVMMVAFSGLTLLMVAGVCLLLKMLMEMRHKR